MNEHPLFLSYCINAINYNQSIDFLVNIEKNCHQKAKWEFFEKRVQTSVSVPRTVEFNASIWVTLGFKSI